MKRRVATFAVMASLAAWPAEGSALSRSLTRQAYALAIELDFSACYEMLDRAEAADPLDPAPPRAVAAVTWLEVLFSQGAATFEAFTGGIDKGEVERPVASPALVARFRIRIEQAQRLAAQQLSRHDDVDAQYQSGASDAVAALYGGTVEGRLLGSLREGRRAVAAMQRVRDLAPGHREAALVLGISEYTVSSMSWLVRLLARPFGLTGNRNSALSLLGEAATPGAETESEAELLLMIVDHREGRPFDAVQRLERLKRRHPRNRLLWLNQGASALAANLPVEAARVLSSGLSVHDVTAAPAVLGEAALWFTHLGTALARQHRSTEAAAHLARALASEPRDWVRGRIHDQLGDLALAIGDTARARREYGSALVYARRGGDDDAVDKIKPKVEALGKTAR